MKHADGKTQMHMKRPLQRVGKEIPKSHLATIGLISVPTTTTPTETAFPTGLSLIHI